MPARALHILELSNTSKVHSTENFSRNENIYYFRRPKCGERHEAFDSEAGKYTICLSTTLDHHGKPVKCGYDDVQKLAFSSLFSKLNSFEIQFPELSPQSRDFRMFSLMKTFKILLSQLTRSKYKLLRVKLHLKVSSKPIRRSTMDIWIRI